MGSAAHAARKDQRRGPGPDARGQLARADRAHAPRGGADGETGVGRHDRQYRLGGSAQPFARRPAARRALRALGRPPYPKLVPPRMSFTLKFLLALALGLATAVIIAPFAAAGIAAAGFHFPFPRIFDRTVMVTLLVALLCFARPLRVAELLRAGFARPRANLVRVGAGLLLALVAVGVLFGIAAYFGTSHSLPFREIAMRASSAVVAAIVIGIIEEGFFPAFLLGGLERDLRTACPNP